jgi:WD40 repeat protein
MIKYLPTIIFFIATISCLGQGSKGDFTKHDPTPEGKSLHCDIDLLPGGNKCIIASALKGELIIAETENLNQVEHFEVGNWKAGSRIDISPDGTYVLLKQLFYLDFSPNKYREVEYEVLEISTGKVVLKIDKAHDADFHPDGKKLVVLEGDQVYSYAINGNEKKTLFPVPEATNCLGISKDGEKIAISHKPEDGYLENFVTKKRQKKNFKLYKKYRQCISVFDTETFEKLYTVDEMFDIPYLLEFGPKDDFILCYSVPHTKIVQKTGMQGSRYISKINAKDGSNTSVAFVSNSFYEPDIEFSHDGRFLALVTMNMNGRPEVWVADYHTGDLVGRYELAHRMFGGHMKGELAPDSGRVGVAFTKDDKQLLFTYGSIIIKWNIPYKS